MKNYVHIPAGTPPGNTLTADHENETIARDEAIRTFGPGRVYREVGAPSATKVEQPEIGKGETGIE